MSGYNETPVIRRSRYAVLQDHRSISSQRSGDLDILDAVIERVAEILKFPLEDAWVTSPLMKVVLKPHHEIIALARALNGRAVIEPKRVTLGFCVPSHSESYADNMVEDADSPAFAPHVYLPDFSIDWLTKHEIAHALDSRGQVPRDQWEKRAALAERDGRPWWRPLW
jgi:hypothetical protein